MTNKKKSKRSHRKSKANQKLASLFKLSREQLEARRTSGGGLHKTHKDTPRAEQNRRAIRDQVE